MRLKDLPGPVTRVKKKKKRKQDEEAKVASPDRLGAG